MVCIQVDSLFALVSQHIHCLDKVDEVVVCQSCKVTFVELEEHCRLVVVEDNMVVVSVVADIDCMC